MYDVLCYGVLGYVCTVCTRVMPVCLLCVYVGYVCEYVALCVYAMYGRTLCVRVRVCVYVCTYGLVLSCVLFMLRMYARVLCCARALRCVCALRYVCMNVRAICMRARVYVMFVVCVCACVMSEVYVFFWNVCMFRCVCLFCVMVFSYACVYECLRA